METVVHCHIFDPKNSIFKQVKKDPAECDTVTCTLEHCELRAKGECMMVAIFGAKKCPYGKFTREVGFTSKARKYSEWIYDRKQKYKGVPFLKEAPCKLAFVGDYVYVPYPFANAPKGIVEQWKEKDSDIPFLSYSNTFSGSPLIAKKDWTLETVLKLIDFRPSAMFGGEIPDYQAKSVPSLIAHLRENDPVMYEELIKVRPELDKTPNFIGRIAFIKTLKPGIVIPAYNSEYPVVWKWDGEFLTTDSVSVYNSTWGNISGESLELKMKPKDNAVVKVADNAWVTENTKFKD